MISMRIKMFALKLIEKKCENIKNGEKPCGIRILAFQNALVATFLATFEYDS